MLETALELLLANVCMAAPDPEAKTLDVIEDIRRKLLDGDGPAAGTDAAGIEPLLGARLESLKSTVEDMIREAALRDDPGAR